MHGETKVHDETKVPTPNLNRSLSPIISWLERMRALEEANNDSLPAAAPPLDFNTYLMFVLGLLTTVGITVSSVAATSSKIRHFSLLVGVIVATASGIVVTAVGFVISQVWVNCCHAGFGFLIAASLLEISYVFLYSEPKDEVSQASHVEISVQPKVVYLDEDAPRNTMAFKAFKAVISDDFVNLNRFVSFSSFVHMHHLFFHMKGAEELAKRLHEACLSGSVETLDALIEEDQLILNRVNKTDYFSSETPLHVAEWCGHLDFTKALLNRKPKLPTELDLQKCSALHVASTEGHLQIVRELYKVNKDICNEKDQDGN